MCAAQSACAKRFEFFAGMHSLLRVKFGQHIDQRLCVHLALSRFVLTR